MDSAQNLKLFEEARDIVAKIILHGDLTDRQRDFAHLAMESITEIRNIEADKLEAA